MSAGDAGEFNNNNYSSKNDASLLTSSPTQSSSTSTTSLKTKEEEKKEGVNFDSKKVPVVVEATSHSTSSSVSSSQSRRLSLFGSRALAAGSKGRLSSSSIPATTPSVNNSSAITNSSSLNGEHGNNLTSFGTPRRDVASFIHPSTNLSSNGKYLVVGDGLMAPFMALCLRVHGLDCDLAHHSTLDSHHNYNNDNNSNINSSSTISTYNTDLDRGTIVLTPSLTQVMGDVLNVSVPSGSVVGRILTFDHVGNDMCDVDLNEFREKGESPTFFCCDRLKLERALLSLCHVGPHRCHVLPRACIDKGGVEAIGGGGVRVRFTGGGPPHEYLGLICTSRAQALVPELTCSELELQQRAENAERYRQSLATAVRWLELCVPPLPALARHERRFTPGSQEIVELLTPRDAKMTVRPTMMATKLFYNVSITIPDAAADPRLRSSSTKQFWDDVIMHWTSGVPGYIPHTMFRPMMTHMQQHFSKSSALIYRTPLFLMPHWSEGGGRVIKIAHAVHGAAFDAIDVGDAQGFTDCFMLARTLANGEDVEDFLRERRLQVMEELDHHALLLNYGVKERGQLAYMKSRFAMKIMRRYKKSWRSILQNYVTLMPKIAK